MNRIFFVPCLTFISFGSVQASDISLEPNGQKTDQTVSVFPDFISNCDMAYVSTYLAHNHLNTLTNQYTFEDTSYKIKGVLLKTHELNNSKTNITQTAFQSALEQLAN